MAGAAENEWQAGEALWSPENPAGIWDIKHQLQSTTLMS